MNKGGKAWPFFLFWLELPDVVSDSESEGLNVGLYRNVRINDLNLSVGITNPRRLNLIFIPSVTVKYYILYKFTLIFIYIFYK